MDRTNAHVPISPQRTDPASESTEYRDNHTYKRLDEDHEATGIILEGIKQIKLRQYGINWGGVRNVALVHLVSLSARGAIEDSPDPLATAEDRQLDWSSKDALGQNLHCEVCGGKVLLVEARCVTTTDEVTVYDN